MRIDRILESRIRHVLGKVESDHRRLTARHHTSRGSFRRSHGKASRGNHPHAHKRLHVSLPASQSRIEPRSARRNSCLKTLRASKPFSNQARLRDLPSAPQ
jgi:hypothetical protein